MLQGFLASKIIGNHKSLENPFKSKKILRNAQNFVLVVGFLVPIIFRNPFKHASTCHGFPASLGHQSASFERFEDASSNLCFDSKHIGPADHASRAVVYLKPDNGSNAAEACVFLFIWSFALFHLL